MENEVPRPKQFFVDIIGFGDDVDIMPLILETMERCRFRHDFTAQDVAELIALEVRGKYIPVDILDRIEKRMLCKLTRPVIKMVQSAHRIAQLNDPNLRFWQPYFFLENDLDCCAAAKAKFHKWLKSEELEVLPLRDCERSACHCAYHYFTRRDLERRPCLPAGWSELPAID